MRKTHYTEEQIAFALRQAEAGLPTADICRKLGISEATFFRWRRCCTKEMIFGRSGIRLRR